jgi:hypothetical protein
MFNSSKSRPRAMARGTLDQIKENGLKRLRRRRAGQPRN